MKQPSSSRQSPALTFSLSLWLICTACASLLLFANHVRHVADQSSSSPQSEPLLELLSTPRRRQSSRKLRSQTEAKATTTTTTSSIALHQQLQQQRDETTNHGLFVTSSATCTRRQLDRVLEDLPPQHCVSQKPWRNECSITHATKCPDSSAWLGAHYTSLQLQRQRQGVVDSMFVGINVGCNKAFDAVQMLRMGTFDTSIQSSLWKKALGHNISNGVCGQEDESDFPVDAAAAQSSSMVRPGRVHCVEPMHGTVLALQEAGHATGYIDKGLVVHPPTAVADRTNGTAYFPTAPQLQEGPLGYRQHLRIQRGTENMGIDTCRGMKRHKRDALCTPIPTTTLDQLVHDQQQQQDKKNLLLDRIHILKIDVEGYDHAVLLGGGRETLQRTEYVEFEYNWKGEWKEASLRQTVDTLDSLGFTCYWSGQNKLWRLTSCWLDHFEEKFWSNVACAHRRLAPSLATRMEQVFENTLKKSPLLQTE